MIDTLSLWSIENLTAMVRLIVRMLPIITCHTSLLAEAISIEVVVKTQRGGACWSTETSDVQSSS